MTCVLITGATGEVGRLVVPELERHFELRPLSLDGDVADPRHRAVDLLDRSALAAAMQGCDAVLHLAIAPGQTGTFEDDAFNDLRFDVNVNGTHHVFEAARRAGVRRVVYVSSLMVVWGHGLDQMVPGDAPPRPVGTYALTKTLGEVIAAYYARSSALEVLVLRIAGPLDLAAVAAGARRARPQQVPGPDLARAFVAALTCPLEQFEIVTIVGESSRRIWDLEPARRVLGYEPQVRLDDLGIEFLDPFDVPNTENIRPPFDTPLGK